LEAAAKQDKNQSQAIITQDDEDGYYVLRRDDRVKFIIAAAVGPSQQAPAARAGLTVW
jgi:hypothetical protein